MGIRLFVEVLDHAPATLTWRERWALGVLAETANDATRECWPGIEDDPVIAHRMRLPGRSSRYEVIKALRQKGALEGVSAGRRGRRAVYRIPVLRPLEVAGKGPETPDAIDEKGSGVPGHSVRSSRTQSETKGPENLDPNSEIGSGFHPDRVRVSPRKGPGSPDPFPSYPSHSSSQPASQQATDEPGDYGIPDDARPLVDGLTAAGVVVRWPFQGTAWFPVLALIKKCGVTAMVEHATRAAARAEVSSARYFMRGWGELPPLPPPGTARPQLRAVNGDRQQQTTDDLFDRAMARARARMQQEIS
ncbi:hypothetical protein RM844_30500 [Streptomyces sp. DSM 44915]|uniref:Helix-turn-helix domain-containing protein n=1 Tax=Streptomyces chisholmiae TaxID=3075540 RepID=A0ABU2K050_9ACTN|nr:hypothetical protein [Streptomyces sp. DSM 44915]MDT0270612.1 hypothetical protein [Streptomyces sp. DSM 44915]